MKTALICITIYSLFSGLLAFTHDQQHFALLRFCGALGMGGMWTSGAALIAETWRPERRARRRADANGLTCWRDSGYQPDGNRQLG